MPSTERSSKKKTPAKVAPAAPAAERTKQNITFGTPIDTDKIRVEVDGTIIRYLIKATGERLEKDYGNPHAVMIIHGRISHNPHGPYTEACLGKIRAANLKSIPL